MKSRPTFFAFFTIYAMLAGCQSSSRPIEKSRLGTLDSSRAVELKSILHQGDNQYALRDFDAAILTYSKAMGCDQKDIRIYWRIAIAAERAGRPEIGIGALQTLVTLDTSLETNPHMVDVARSLVTMQRAAAERDKSLRNP